MSRETIILNHSNPEHAAFLDQGLQDTILHREYENGDEVAVCGKCMKVFLRMTWDNVKHSHPCGANHLADILPTSGSGPQLIYFAPNEDEVYTPGTPVELKWEIVRNPREVTLNGESVSHTGRLRVSPRVPTVYELIAKNSFGTIRLKKKVVCEIKDVVIHHFSSDRSHLEKKEPVTLSWNVEHAERIYIEPNIGEVNASGSIEVMPRHDIRYSLKAFGYGSDPVSPAHVNITVSKKKPTIVHFQPETFRVEEEKKIEISWIVRNADRVQVSPGVGFVSKEKKIEVDVRRETVFTIRAVTYFGEEITESFKVSVTDREPEIAYFIVAPRTLLEGQTARMSWKSTDIGSTCEVTIVPEPGPVISEGSIEIKPSSSHEYTMQSENYFGNMASSSCAVRVIPFPRSNFTNRRSDVNVINRVIVPEVRAKAYPRFEVQPKYTDIERVYARSIP